MTTNEARTWTTKQVAAISGATIRELQLWHETGMICPVVEKHLRQYTTEQLYIAIALNGFKAKGHSIHSTRPFAKALAARLKAGICSPWWRPVEKMVYLVSNKKHLFTPTSARLGEVVTNIVGPMAVLWEADIVARIPIVRLTKEGERYFRDHQRKEGLELTQ